MSKAAAVVDFGAIPWRRLPCSRSQLRLDITLKCGQSFRWSTHEDKSWLGVMRGKLWLLSQDEDNILYKCFPEQQEEGVEKELLTDYFQLQVDLVPLYESWSNADPVFEKTARSFTGVRMLRQDPVENLFSFICSSNNNIQRISSMVENLCTHYGESVCQVKTADTSKTFFRFPSISSLAINTAELEGKLRSLSFGYRAGYIAKTAAMIEEKGGEEYLFGLRKLTYEEARKELLQFTGVGPKVADCILLMSMDQPSAIPVDTHMFQIAASKYLPHLKGYKSVTDKVYTEIGDHFRQLYGDYAGWAHSVLFSADLKHLQDKESESKDGKKQRGLTAECGGKKRRKK